MPAVCLWARGGRDGAPETAVAMIDDFALGLTMFLILTALWRIAASGAVTGIFVALVEGVRGVAAG